MSEEQRNEETEVEAHNGPKPYSANDEPRDETDDEVEGHIMLDRPRPHN